jgi:hypothetical protein
MILLGQMVLGAVLALAAVSEIHGARCRSVNSERMPPGSGYFISIFF